jgi:hypothetical protein
MVSTSHHRIRTLRRERCFSAGLAVCAVGICFCAGERRASAQSVARFSLESVVAVDEFAATGVSHRPQIIVDVSLAVRLRERWQLFVRPWFRKPRPASPTAPVPDWDTQLYQGGIRYERPGAVSTRVDAGYILSPIGLGVFDTRPGINPTIAPHISYLTPMPVFEPTGPRVSAISGTYPLGAQVTASTTRWDARAAVINSAPTRIYALGAVTNPKPAPAIVAGGGVTPVIGLRLGVAAAHGIYATPSEITTHPANGRAMTMVAGEGEWAFAGTKLNAEIVRTAFETSANAAVAYEWFVQGMQTLSPRWFAAARHEGTSAPPLINGIVVGTRTRLQSVEATAGYRVTPDFTLRGSYLTRRFYGARSWADQVGVSLVWSRRWW